MKSAIIHICLLTSLLIFRVSNLHAQISNTDSLLQVIRTSGSIDERLENVRFYTFYYIAKDSDSTEYSGKQLIKLGIENKFPEVEITGRMQLASAKYKSGKIYDALSLAIEALKLAEKAPHPLLLSMIYSGLSVIYANVNSEKALMYSKRGLSYVNELNTPAAIIQKASLYNNIGARNFINKEFDSSLAYYQKAELMSRNLKIFSTGLLLGNFGNLYMAMNKRELALTYYRLALERAITTNSLRTIRTAYMNLGNYYFDTGNEDSALHYYRLRFTEGDSTFPSPQSIEAMLKYSRIYKQRSDHVNAFTYLEKHRVAKLQLDSSLQSQQLQTLTFEEDQRQSNIEEQEIQKNRDRNRNLQYAAISLGLVAFIILFFLLSHTVFANQRLINFLGMLALLIVFEFLNLLLHPFLSKWTNNSPFLMLASMVLIAAMLIPLHHRLQHWITNRLVEKNKKIRLAAAKKTISSLEASNHLQNLSDKS